MHCYTLLKQNLKKIVFKSINRVLLSVDVKRLRPKITETNLFKHSERTTDYRGKKNKPRLIPIIWDNEPALAKILSHLFEVCCTSLNCLTMQGSKW